MTMAFDYKIKLTVNKRCKWKIFPPNPNFTLKCFTEIHLIQVCVILSKQHKQAKTIFTHYKTVQIVSSIQYQKEQYLLNRKCKKQTHDELFYYISKNFEIQPTDRCKQESPDVLLLICILHVCLMNPVHVVPPACPQRPPGPPLYCHRETWRHHDQILNSTDFFLMQRSSTSTLLCHLTL